MNTSKDAVRRAVANGKPVDWDVIAPPRPTLYANYLRERYSLYVAMMNRLSLPVQQYDDWAKQHQGK